MSYINYSKLEKTEVKTDPFNYLVVKDFIKPDALENAIIDYPRVPGPGSHPPTFLDIKPGFKRIIDELYSNKLQSIVEDKFNVDLSNRPKIYTVRGFCRASDGGIHTDSKTKIITCLLYMNDKNWSTQNSLGNLRILRDGHNLENFVEEISPTGGTLLLFERNDHSWHGHHKFEGERRAIQLNWVTNRWVVFKDNIRHNFNSQLKKLFH